VLLARLQRQHEAARPVGVRRLAHDPAGHPADQLRAAAKKPNDGPP
jgi:hypothetical protein